MLGRLRLPSARSSANHGTSHYGVEILALFGGMHLAQAMKSTLTRCKNERADKDLAGTEGRKRQFALILHSQSVGCSAPCYALSFVSFAITRRPLMHARARRATTQ